MPGAKDPRELRNGDNLEVVFVGGNVVYYRIKRIDNIFYRDEHSSLSAGGEESFSTVTALDPPIDQFYYFYSAEIDGNFRMYLRQPAATNRWGTNRSPQGGFLNDRISPLTSNKNIELWCAENYPPAVQLTQDINVAVTPVIWWIGKTISVTRLDSKPANYTPIQVGGVAE